jgi:hypothetical protein
MEHLGTADGMIIQVRRRLLRAVRALREEGTPPPGLDAPELYRVRSASAIFPRHLPWAEALREWHSAQAGLPAQDESGRFLQR